MRIDGHRKPQFVVGKSEFAFSVPALHRPVGGDQSFVAADEGADVAVAQLLRGVARERGAETAAAIHDELRVRVGIKFFQVAFENAFAEVNGLRGVAGGPFVVLAHIQQHGLGIGRESRARFGHADFGDAFLRVVDEIEKTR